MLESGDTIDGRYRVSKLLGEGTMGTVYLAEHALIGRRVAVKLLRPELAADPEVVERFMNEARAAGTLGHDHICESTDMGFTHGVPYIVLEYLEGVVLADEIHARGELPTRRVVRIAQQIAGALQAAHSAGIVHRDLKSDNVFLTDREGRPDHVKVLDFGISEFVDAAKQTPGRGLIAGTPEFMAPEQITSPTNVDARADIYALGVILYHMLAGHRPFGDDLEVLLHRIVHEPVPPMTRDLPPRLSGLVARMLAKRPEDRPQTMTEVEDELRHLGETFQTGPVPRLTTRSEIEAPASAPAPVEVKPAARRRRLPVLWIAGGGAVALAAIVAIVMAGRNEAPSPRANATPPAPAAAPGAPAPAAPAPAPADQPPVDPASVELVVRADAPDAHFTLRRRTHKVGEKIIVPRGEVAEVIEVSAPGRQTRRFWLTLDRSAMLQTELPRGRGTIEATEAETLVALGEAAPAEVDPVAQARVAAKDPVGPPAPTARVAAKDPVRPPTPTAPTVANKPKPPQPTSPPPSAGSSAAGSARTTVDKPPASGSSTAPSTEPKVATPTKPPPDAGAPVRPAAPTIDNAAVKATVRSHIAEIQLCYERGRMDNLDLAGRVVMQIAIGTDGRVASAGVESSTLNAPKVDACIAKTIKSWQFPAAVGGQVVISYPFVLK